LSTALTNITTTSNYDSAKRIKWETELMEKAANRLLIEKFATTKTIGKGEAGTLRFNKLLRLAKKTTQDSESTLYTAADAKRLLTNYIDVTPMRFGDSFGFTDDVSIEAFITDEDNKGEIATQFANSMEYQAMKVLCQGGMRQRADNDSTYTVSGTCDSGSSATALVDDALTQADDAWKGGYATSTKPTGQCYDETSPVSDFDAASDTATVAFTNTLDTTSKYRMVVGTGLTSSDIITTTNILYVNLLHTMLGTTRFKGGTLNAFIHPQQEHDLWGDSVWADTAKYDDSGRYTNYKLVRWLGMNWHVGSNDVMYREDVDGTENQSGAVYIAPIFGAKAYSLLRWGQGHGDFGVEWHYKDKADSGDLRNMAKFISWKAKFAAKVMRSTSVINLMTGATDANLLV